MLLDAPAADLESVLTHHGFIQIDPINVCGRMHDLILRNRVADYREGDLMRHLHGTQPLPAEERTAFEHHLPHSNNLAALPVSAWPFLQSAMRQRTEYESAWSGKLDERQTELAPQILAELAARGPFASDSIANKERDAHGWGTHATLAKTTLHKLFFHGRILISRRENQRRLYDLPERVLPAAILARPEPSPTETARWITLLKLRQWRLTPLLRAEIPLVADDIQEIAVDGCPPLFCLKSDLPLLDLAADPSSIPLLLAPLDPLIYHRRVTRSLWDFDYTWEVYVPPEKRVRGYYALPVLAGLELVGHIDPKADRKAKKLAIIHRSLRRGYSAAPAVRELARFLGLK